MKLHTWFCIGLLACGGKIDGTNPGNTGTENVHAEPPPPPSGGTPTRAVLTFAIQHLYWGDTRRGETTLDTNAWKDFGFDLDGKTSSTQSLDVCTLQSGASRFVQEDGQDGIDNGWGRGLLPLFQALGKLTTNVLPRPSQEHDEAIAQGRFTLEIQVVGLSDDPKQSANGLAAQVFLGAPLGTAPTFDTRTDWPVRTDSLLDGKTLEGGAKYRSDSAFVTKGTFVGKGRTLVVPYLLDGSEIPIAIYDAVIVFDHVSHAEAVHGTIAGVLHTGEIAADVHPLAGHFSKSLCGKAFDAIAYQMEMNDDIESDETSAPNVACDAISIGLGFDAKLVANPTKVVAPPPMPPDPCK